MASDSDQPAPLLPLNYSSPATEGKFPRVLKALAIAGICVAALGFPLGGFEIIRTVQMFRFGMQRMVWPLNPPNGFFQPGNAGSLTWNQRKQVELEILRQTPLTQQHLRQLDQSLQNDGRRVWTVDAKDFTAEYVHDSIVDIHSETDSVGLPAEVIRLKSQSDPPTSIRIDDRTAQFMTGDRIFYDQSFTTGGSQSDSLLNRVQSLTGKTPTLEQRLTLIDATQFPGVRGSPLAVAKASFDTSGTLNLATQDGFIVIVPVQGGGTLQMPPPTGQNAEVLAVAFDGGATLFLALYLLYGAILLLQKRAKARRHLRIYAFVKLAAVIITLASMGLFMNFDGWQEWSFIGIGAAFPAIALIVLAQRSVRRYFGDLAALPNETLAARIS